MALEPTVAKIVANMRSLIERTKLSGNQEHARAILYTLDGDIEIAKSCINPNVVEELLRELLSLRDEARELLA